jgi:mannose-binding lectin 2
MGPASRAALLAAAALVALAGRAGAADAQFSVMSDHSFKGPYRSYQGDGARTLEHWTAGGSTEVNEHFVRLTNDRQSRKGWLWSTRNWAWLDGWTITLRLRVSGQGKRLFGDGMAFWFTTSSEYKPGAAHGFSDTFKGFGIMCVRACDRDRRTRTRAS